MIPSSRLVPTSLNKGRPVVLDEPNSEVSTAVRQLAARFTNQFQVAGAVAGSDANGNGSVKAKRKRFSRTAS